MKNLSRYLSLIKFSHTIFALPFAVIGYFLGIKTLESGFNAVLFVLVVLCMVLARTAAMSFNRYADRHFDRLNERTKSREIPTGTVSARSALFLAVISSILFVATTYFINSICFLLSPVALLIVLGYTYTKRFTNLCHFILGLGLSLAPIGSYLAVTGEFAVVPLFYSGAVFFWVAGFDIIYSLQDAEFDSAQKLYSIPASIGGKYALLLSRAAHIISTAFLLMAGWHQQAQLPYWIGFSVFVLLLIYQHSLVKPHDLSRVNLAFFTTNGIASILFATTVVLDLLLF